MLDYGLEYEIVEKNYARTFNVSDDVLKEKEEARRGHLPFTDKEIETMWQNVNKTRYVDIENWTFTGGMKTEAGKNRIVPIHPKVRELVKARYEEAESLGSKYLFNCTDTKTHRSSNTLTYDKYQKRFIKLRDELKLNPQHRPHDPRKHFVSMAKKYGVDEYAIKYMVGHSITDITEKIYTDRELTWLQTEIEKIE